ncbi:UNVERIFIED_CONTAM: DNA polymerase epsilon catalytic subunit A [Sesamum angustifolium]|uniref:DNA polymerase epsilon catalytic subunit n=1 Tax=Sesamum angustifolium TaxID=2727405 RepID=A0AAW2QQE8_9LAMI
MNGTDNRRRDRRDTRISKKQKLILNAEEQLESKLGFDAFTEGEKRLGWLLTFASDGSTFKAKYKFRPYFYAATKDNMEMDVEAYLRRRYEGQVADIAIVEKEDLDLVKQI